VYCGEYTNGIANDYNSVMVERNVVSGAWDRRALHEPGSFQADEPRRSDRGP
jgi:hypothetical protein